MVLPTGADVTDARRCASAALKLPKPFTSPRVRCPGRFMLGAARLGLKTAEQVRARRAQANRAEERSLQ